MKYKLLDDDLPFKYNETIPGRFFEVFNNYESSIAFIQEEESITYRELGEIARRIAKSLITLAGSKPGNVVIILNNAKEILTVILACLISGKTYVPADLKMGRKWVDYIIEETNPDIIVIDSESMDFSLGQSKPNIAVKEYSQMLEQDILTKDELNSDTYRIASILYTSGSTGIPKGVMQSQNNLMHHVKLLTETFNIHAKDIHTLFPSFIHDASTSDMFCTLLNGATLVRLDLKKNGFEKVLSQIKKNHITIYHSTPTVYRELILSSRTNEDFSTLKCVILGGEPVRKEDFISFKKKFSEDCIFINGYGATETSGFVAVNKLRKTDTVKSEIIPIGKAPGDIKLFLLDEELKPNKNTGELVVEWDHVGLGYYNKKNETDKVYKKGLFDSDNRVYFTGDYGCVMEDGSIQLTGRKDKQVKVNGYRIHLAEIEAAIVNKLTGCKVAVYANQIDEENAEIIANIVLKENTEFEEKLLKEELEKTIPCYAIPNKFFILKELPLSNTSKVDYKKLAALEIEREGLETRERVISIWKQILNAGEISMDAKLFDYGVTSLMIMRVQRLIRQELDLKIPLAKYFAFPTLGEFIDYVEQLANEQKILE